MSNRALLGELFTDVCLFLKEIDMNRVYVTSVDWSQKACVLTTEDGQPVKVGQKVKDFRGDPAKVVGGSAPHKSNSTGRVDTDQGSYYPSVYGLKWTPHTQVTGSV